MSSDLDLIRFQQLSSGEVQESGVGPEEIPESQRLPVRRTVTDEAIDKLRGELNLQEEEVRANYRLGIRFPQELMGDAYQEWLRSFTPEQARRAEAGLFAIRSGFFAVLPRVCTGLAKCPHAHICPFSENVPVDQTCPAEMAYVRSKMEGYMDEYAITGHHKSAFTLLNRLVELDLLDLRTSSMLAGPRYQDLMVSRVTGSTVQGDILENEELNPLLEAKERISREKMKLMGVLVGTPEAQYKKAAAMKEAATNEYSSKIAKMNQRLLQVETMLGDSLDEGVS